MLSPVGPDGVRPDQVRERVYDVEADGGVRAVEDGRAGAAAATVDLLDTLRERRGRRQWVPDASEDPDEMDPLELAVDQLRVRAEALGEPPAAHPARSRPEELEDPELLALPEAPPAAKPTPKPAPKPAAKPAPKAAAKPAAAPAQPPSGSRRAARPAVEAGCRPAALGRSAGPGRRRRAGPLGLGAPQPAGERAELGRHRLRLAPGLIAQRLPRTQSTGTSDSSRVRAPCWPTSRSSSGRAVRESTIAIRPTATARRSPIRGST